ncbi:MAG: S41 family peptidase [Dehalococcoidales bacterium]|nr:S41 family peptidase [Dehalococcoidales bacterium]
MPKPMKITIVSIAVSLSLLVTFSAGCLVGNRALPVEVSSGISVVDQVWGLLFSKYVEPEKLDAASLSGGAIKGMMDTLDDPYSDYLSKESYEFSISSIRGTFGGIGAHVGMRDGKITIVAPIDGSPADQAGIKAGDIIVEIEGESTDNLTLNEAVLRIRGETGTPVTFKVIHLGETEPVELTITRDDIELSSVYHEILEDIAYIRITNFSDRTNDELTPVLQSIEENAASGIILDLRSNPGGLLESVVDVTSRFLKEGYVLHSRDNKGEKDSYSVVNSGRKTDLPMVILTDNYTASASEVLSGALQDYDRAVVAGTVTWGKGSVNTLFSLKDGSGVYITTHRWLTPEGRLIEGEGITPDFELTDEDPVDWAINYLHNGS